jgi:uncharacterized protein YndB with AHSA1/START domain
MAAEPVRAAIHVDALPERVFAYFTDAEAMVAWMGDSARLEPTVGGEFAVDVRGVAVRGRYLELDPPHRLVFSWGHEGSAELPPAASTVEVRLVPARGGTNVVIEHRDLPGPRVAGHRRGWDMFLRRLAVAAGGEAGELGPPADCVSARPRRSTGAAGPG